MSSEVPAIEVRGLRKRYEIYEAPRDRLLQLVVPRIHGAARRAASLLGMSRRFGPPPRYFREFWALNDVSFELRRGETLGVIGRNGSGKSTLLQILAGTLAATSGERVVRGRIAALLELGSGFNPEFSGRDNVFLNGRILGLTQREVAERFDQIVEFADIGEFIERPVKTYSTGMFVRLAFAVQAHIDAAIVIIDEALAVGDVFFRQKCYARLQQLRDKGAAILLVSHSMPEIEQFCERALLLHRGVARFLGPAAEATKHYYLIDQDVRLRIPAYEQELETAVPRQPAAARPPAEALLDLSKAAPVGNGQARCTAVAICDERGRPCRAFRQGERAHFFYEFELAEPIGVPICGMVLTNDRGVIVFGKNSWQYERDVPASGGAGSKVSCWQLVELDLATGDYTFEVGLASVTPAQWKERARTPQQETHLMHRRICHVPNVGMFSVGLAIRNGVPTLTHHGIANLPGDMVISCHED